MAEAEDVLIEAAAHVAHRVRAVWDRGRETGDALCEQRRRRLETWQAAWLGRVRPIVASAPPSAPGAMVRLLRRPPPWRARPLDVPTHDGRRIYVPRAWLADPDPEAADRALCTALGLAWRLARRCDPAPVADPVERDLAWVRRCVEAERALERDWPGLAEPLARVRREALGDRPALAALRADERRVETAVREALGAGPASDAHPDRPLESRRSRAAAAYRGVAPVLHWGAPTPRPPPSPDRDPREDVSASAAPGSPSAPLRRPVDTPADDESTSERPAPFVLAPTDAHLALDAPGETEPPADQGPAEDPEALADEMARLGALPRVRRPGEVREVVEGGDPSSAGGAPASATPGGARTWLYPEWDTGAGRYRDPGCRVRERATGPEDGAWAERVLDARRGLRRRLRRQLESLRPRTQRLRRQPEGDDVDLGGWVEEWADRQAGRTARGRVYAKEHRLRRDVAVTLLLDASASTEGGLDGGRRVIDVVKETTLLFGDALAALGDRHCILAFASQGAGDVRVRRLKDFTESAGPAVRARIGGLAPDGFTRLGAAIRHAGTGLARQPARARLLLVLSDGKPQDEDAYEGEYGIADSRRAVAEVRGTGVRVFAVTVDREGPEYLPRLFGPHGYTVLQNASALPERLPALYRRLTSGA